MGIVSVEIKIFVEMIRRGDKKSQNIFVPKVVTTIDAKWTFYINVCGEEEKRNVQSVCRTIKMNMANGARPQHQKTNMCTFLKHFDRFNYTSMCTTIFYHESIHYTQNRI